MSGVIVFGLKSDIKHPPDRKHYVCAVKKITAIKRITHILNRDYPMFVRIRSPYSLFQIIFNWHQVYEQNIILN